MSGAASGSKLAADETIECPRLGPLSRTAQTKDGQRVDPNEELWTLRKRIDGGGVLRIDWSRVPGLTPRSLHIAKLIVAAKMPAWTASNVFNEWRCLVRFGAWYARSQPDGPSLDWANVDEGLMESFMRHGLANTKSAGNDFARIRALYKYGVTVLRLESEFVADFDTAVLLSLSQLRAPGNPKGVAVREGDPLKGELTPPEIDVIIEKLRNHTDYPHLRATVWLSLELGRNALQFTLARNRDLYCARIVQDGVEQRVYQLALRRTKKRKAVDDQALWPISTPLGDLLTSLQTGAADDRLLNWIADGYSEKDLGEAMHQWARRVNAVSPRTGKLLWLNARRFRTTMLTNAADEGASKERLAALADHSDFQNILVYIDRSPLFLERIGPKVDAIYDPIVSRFKGTWTTADAVGAPNGAPRRVIPGRSAHLPVLDVGGIGLCGRKDICRLAPPLTCYACESFIAFRDGPHEQVVAALEAAMAQVDDRMALQIAPALAAAREVVRAVADDRVALL